MQWDKVQRVAPCGSYKVTCSLKWSLHWPWAMLDLTGWPSDRSIDWATSHGLSKALSGSITLSSSRWFIDHLLCATMFCDENSARTKTENSFCLHGHSDLTVAVVICSVDFKRSPSSEDTLHTYVYSKIKKAASFLARADQLQIWLCWPLAEVRKCCVIFSF